ncbi:unnamed protein product [Eruca vesicaria subsp. sativa]|uniref:Uncharacterized protein n=1 Tax=Eruca vesicaria subsp. sativa TaxID=29727 RepID=A0ABC8LK27_ERUVS|nr:unnamed protein product [Eruca vesicaria subsp. sativa]
MASPSLNTADDGDVVIGEAADGFKDSVASSPLIDMETEGSSEKSPAWVEWRETSESTALSSNPDEASMLPNGEVQNEKEDNVDYTDKEGAKDSSPGACGDEAIEKSSDASGMETTEISAGAREAEITEKLKDFSAAESDDESAQSSEPAIAQETDKSQQEADDVAAKAGDKESEEAVK